MKRVFFLLLTIFFFGCSSDDDAGKSNEKLLIEQYLEDNNLTATLTSGVYQYVIADNPTGNASGDVFTIYYTLTNLKTAEVIDSHLVADGEPIRLKHQASAVFPVGLDDGLTGTREGATYGLIIPSGKAYGNYPVSSQLKGQILHFEIEVVARQSEADREAEEELAITNYIADNDLNNTLLNPVDAVVTLPSGVRYKRLVVGTGSAPTNGDTVVVNYEGRRLEGGVFDELDNLKFLYGSQQLFSGFEDGLAAMQNEGERATFIIPSSEAYGASVRVIPESTTEVLVDQLVVPAYVSRLKPYEVVVFDVTLAAVGASQ